MRHPTAKLFGSLIASLIGGVLAAIAVLTIFGWPGSAEDQTFLLKRGLLTGLVCGLPSGIAFALVRQLRLIVSSVVAGLGTAVLSAIYLFMLIASEMA